MTISTKQQKKPTYRVYNRRGRRVFLSQINKQKKKTGSNFLFSNVFLGSSKNFILNFVGNCTFWRTIFICMGIKRKFDKKWSRLILQGIEKPTPVCSNNECLLWCCLSPWFHLLLYSPSFCCLVCSVFFFSLFFWILVLLWESVLRCRVVGSRSSVGCTRKLITVCNLLAPAANIQSCITWVQPSIKD